MAKSSWGFAIAVALVAPLAAQAQAVYKCGPHAYSEVPCSTRVVRTYEAPVDPPRKPIAVIAHRLPGETDDHYAARKRRVRLSESDRDECARLDAKIPFERERVRNSLQQDEVDSAQDALGEARKRYNQLKC